MIKHATPALVLLLTVGCEGYDRTAHAPGPNAAYAEQADSIPTVTRRVWSGPKADYTIGVTPDGRRAVFTDWDTGDIMLRDLATDDVQNITRNPEPYRPGYGMAPRISPDGKRVVFNWWHAKDTGIQLRVADLDGSDPQVIYDAKIPAYIQAEDWSPDGRTILAFRTQDDGTNQIVLVPSDSGAIRGLKTLDWRQPLKMNFSPDGRFIVYDFPVKENSNSDRDLFVLDLKTGREIHLVEHTANDYLLGWAPDGRHVLFASDRSGTPGAWLLPVEDGTPSGDPLLVKPDLWGVVAVQFTPDGSYFYGADTGNRSVYIAEVDPTIGKAVGSPISLTPAVSGWSFDPAWSPDGKSLAYLIRSNRGNQITAAIRSTETGDVREMPVPAAFSYPFLEWSPDGKALIIAAEEKGRQGLFRMDIQTGKTEVLFKLGHQEGLGGHALLPNGRAALYVKGVGGGTETLVVARDLETGAERVLHNVPSTGGIQGLALSPDGSTIAFAELGRNRRGRIMLLPLSGGEAQHVAGDLIPMPSGRGGITWSADGQSLYTVGRLAGEPEEPSSGSSNTLRRIWRVRLDGGAPEPTGISMVRLGDPRIDPQGRRIAFAAGQSEAEVWVMENFLPGRVAAQQDER